MLFRSRTKRNAVQSRLTQYKENNILFLVIVVVIIMEIRIVPQEKPQTTDRKWRAGTA